MPLQRSMRGLLGSPHRRTMVLIISAALLVGFAIAYATWLQYKPHMHIAAGGKIDDLAFDTNGHLYVVKLSSPVIERRSIEHGRIDMVLSAHSDSVSSIAFNPLRNILVSGSFDTTVILWNAAQGEVIRTLRGHRDGVTDVAVSMSGTLIASSDDSDIIHLWQTESGAILRTIAAPNGSIVSIALSSDD